ncbi:MAG: hypothetical protein U9N84_14595 [Actinomycetota bacterium]|nr:hypothetical protein [Actinomycetota bacterium]
MTGRSNTAIALGAIGALVGVVLILGGMGPMGEYRDADGFYMSDPLTVDRPSHAIVSGDVDLLRGRWETLVEDSLLGFMSEPDDIRMQGALSGPNELFLGIAPTSAVDEYLSGVAHDEITDWNADLAAINEVEYTTHQGTTPPDPPDTEGFWVTSVVGTGTQTLDWTIEPGEWTAVIMNADAAPGITADVAFGAKPSSDIQAIAGTTLAIGAVALLGGGLLLYLGISGQDR